MLKINVKYSRNFKLPIHFIVEDNEKVIIDTIKKLKNNFKYVFTTGGIGPTHDDITSKSIAKAFNLSYGYHKKAYAILEKYYGKDKFNIGRKKMAMMPIKASLILNPSSGAPGFCLLYTSPSPRD